ncbi:LysR family transcriptional regulator [Enterobacteriaceae bacterium LUAb1]
MDFNQIATFVKVVQTGSFSAAARLLDIPVSTVSHRVSMLEKRLRITLLQRTTRQLHLTQAGKQYFEHAAEGLHHFLDAESSISEAIVQPCGLLKVSAPFDIGNDILSTISQEMKIDWPNVKLEFTLVKKYTDLVAEGIDVAIRTGPLNDSTLIARLLGYARWKLYAGSGYFDDNPIIEFPQQVRRHFCLQFPPMGRDSWTLQNSKSSLTINLSNSMLANDVDLIKEMVKKGCGIGLLPSYQCQNDLKMASLIAVLPEWHAKEDPIYIVYPKQPYVSPKLRVFIDIASRHFKKSLAN